MEKNVQELAEAEYLEEIRKARFSAPEMTEDEFWQQFQEMEKARAPQLSPVKAVPSGAGRRRTSVA